MMIYADEPLMMLAAIDVIARLQRVRFSLMPLPFSPLSLICPDIHVTRRCCRLRYVTLPLLMPCLDASARDAAPTSRCRCLPDAAAAMPLIFDARFDTASTPPLPYMFFFFFRYADDKR